MALNANSARRSARVDGADSCQPPFLPSPAHRLGVATSGVILCAKSARAKRSLPAQFQAGTVGKEYRALASGVDMPDEFSCSQPIGLVEVTETLPLANDSHGCSHE